jgi:hypothetical protein
MAITRHINPAQSQELGISDGLICNWTTLSSPSLLAILVWKMQSQEMFCSLPEDL